jgi:hypothetical protein
MFHPMRRLTRVAVVAGIGAAAAYLFDPQQGEARRQALAERLSSLRTTLPGQTGPGAPTEAAGGDGGDGPSAPAPSGGPLGPGLEGRVGNEWRPDVPEPSASHVLEDKVRSEVLGRAEFDRLGVHVNDVQGIIELRGEVAGDEVRGRLVEAVRQVAGVQGVTDLTHQPGEPAPNKAASSGSAGSPA